MSAEVRVDVDNLSQVYALLNKLENAGYHGAHFSWEYRNHIRSWQHDVEKAAPRHVIFNFNDPAVACWFKLIV